MSRQVLHKELDAFRIDSCRSGDNFQVMLVREIEDEYVIGLSIDILLNRVWLICYEGREEAEVPHSRDDVVPVGFAKVKVCLLGEQEDRSELRG